MSSKTLDIYAQRARTMPDPTLASGRLLAAAPQNRAILRDVLTKLDIKPTDNVLDIGSGIGQLAIPLSYMVESVTCVDHPDVLNRLAQSHVQPNIRYFPGDFLSVDLGEQRFSKILAYDVCHYLETQEVVLRFVDKAIGLLAPWGKLLLGDLRNQALLDRLKVAESVQRYLAERMKLIYILQEAQHAADNGVPVDSEIVDFGDGELLDIMTHARAAGHNAYILPQPHDLPLWHQREDIIIEQIPVGPKRDSILALDDQNRPHIFGLRPATDADCRFVYALSQEPGVRASSTRVENFTFAQHQEWWAARMADENCRIYIVEEDLRATLGVVRYGRVVDGRPLWSGGPPATGDGSEAEVSIMLRPEVRGKGMSFYVLTDSAKRAKKELGVTKIIALIKKDNAASIKAFEKAGYRRVGEEQRMGVDLLRYEL